jgi:hypothetical protein
MLLHFINIAVSPVVKRQGREADYSPPSNARLSHSPIRLHVIVLNYNFIFYLKGNGELRLHASVFLSGLKAEEGLNIFARC